MTTLDEYRDRVIRAVGCPACNANPDKQCAKQGADGDWKRVPYIHDDRSFAYEQAQQKAIDFYSSTAPKCPVHLVPEPCPTCSAYIAAGL